MYSLQPGIIGYTCIRLSPKPNTLLTYFVHPLEAFHSEIWFPISAPEVNISLGLWALLFREIFRPGFPYIAAFYPFCPCMGTLVNI